MLLANDASGERSLATPGARATCPGCSEDVIAKCGDIVIWHWSHKALVSECDPWWEESEWHLGWKAKFPKENVEVVIGPHRADVKVAELVVEFQHSSISAADVRAREDFYGNMIWVFDITEASASERFELRDTRGDPDDKWWTFRWRHPVAVIAYCRKPVFLDMGEGLIFELKRLHLDRRPAGWGYLWKESEWLERFEALGPYAPCPDCGFKWFHGHAADCPQSPVAQWRERRRVG